MRQLGAIMFQLMEIRFDRIGSIFEDKNGEFSIGECLSPSLLWQWRDSVESFTDRGPFSEESQYLESLVSMFTSHAKELPLKPHVFFAPIPDSLDYPTWNSYKAAGERWNDFIAIGDKIEHSKNRLSYCIAGQFLKDMIPHICSTEKGGFTLSHPDLHLGNIFVDEDLNITCLIDWGSAISGPVTELLATPGLEGSRSPPSGSQTDAFRLGFNLERVKVDPDDWRKSEMIWYFSRLVRLLSKQDYDLFKGCYEIVYQVDDDDDSPGSINHARLFHERAQQSDNKLLLTELHEDDLSEKEMKEQEEGAFSFAEERKLDNLAIARKLTLISEMNPGFLADQRLWRWIEDALDQDDSK